MYYFEIICTLYTDFIIVLELVYQFVHLIIVVYSQISVCLYVKSGVTQLFESFFYIVRAVLNYYC